MRIGGLASGIDTDNIIKELMNAERIPLNKLEQQKTKMEWQRDAFRDVNKQIFELERLIENRRLNIGGSTVNPKIVSSSNESAITASGSSSAGNGAYRISVEQLASREMHVIDLSGQDFTIPTGEFIFMTYDEASKENDFQAGMYEKSITIEEGDTLQTIAKKISDADKNVQAFYDEKSETFVIETTRSGIHNLNENEDEIVFSGGNDDFFTQLFSAGTYEKVDAKNAKFTYNDVVELESNENKYTLNGITFNFHDVTKDENVTLTVAHDTDKAVENIKEIVDKFNELVETLNDLQNEPVYRDFPPLTKEQMEEMSEKEIELWEEKAKSGLLRRDPILSSSLTNYRSIWSSSMSEAGPISLLADIGITTTENYLDGGKLEIDEEKLRKQLEENGENVNSLLFGTGEGTSRGLFTRLEDSLQNTINQIDKRAGKGSSTSQSYTMGRQLESIEDRIKAFEDRLKQVEDRYWRQFTAMERAISMMNNQSAMLMSFGGNM